MPYDSEALRREIAHLVALHDAVPPEGQYIDGEHFSQHALRAVLRGEMAAVRAHARLDAAMAREARWKPSPNGFRTY